ncbi:hypothetical protein E0H75_37235 [Kribbella capetownensis]|uniref:Uncharacterized protein n=1 Tax=Kribbella capetownensis TaxID=1572659 RepID=A0A4R0JBB9_9ACTN|nr:hypothetical protein [Kribbella capetownensis]TCC43931.1 hypothetical protein E0H75_37235 [Kribbella capetownensis]
MDESVTERLVNADVSAMDGAEMLAHVDAVQQQLRSLQESKLALLEDNPQLVAQSPELQVLLEQLRAEVSGPGS